jgi:fatty acid desaturase
MPRIPDNEPPVDSLVLLVLFTLLLFASPVVYLWSGAGQPWYLPYGLWLLIVGLGAWLFRRRGRRRDGL